MRKQWVVRAEAEAAEATTEVVEEQNGAAAAPLDKARALLEAEELDKAALESALADVEAELVDMRGKLSAAQGTASSSQEQLASTKDQYLRLTADFENFRRRTADEKLALTDKVRGDVLVELLPLVDAFELARTQVKAETEAEVKINNSYQGLYRQMVDIFKAMGVEPVATLDQPFDPEVHEAIMREPSDEVPDGTVTGEFRKGFKIGEKLLRPAMVKVSYNDAPVDTTPAASNEEQQPAEQQQEGSKQ